jgi:hypothetical protein
MQCASRLPVGGTDDNCRSKSIGNNNNNNNNISKDNNDVQ